MAKVFAKQVPPDYQQSPLMLFGEYPEGIVLTGNRQYNSHTTPLYDRIKDYLADMANDWEDAHFYYEYQPGGGYKKCRKKPETTVGELLRDYGFEREDGKAWSARQKHEWKLLMERDVVDDEDGILKALELCSGHGWDTTTLRGCVQGDWQKAFYQKDLWDRERLRDFEAEYFNTGTEWLIHEGDDEPEDPEDICGASLYVNGYEADARKAIAEEAGCKEDEVVLFVVSGYVTRATYEQR